MASDGGGTLFHTCKALPRKIREGNHRGGIVSDVLLFYLHPLRSSNSEVLPVKTSAPYFFAVSILVALASMLFPVEMIGREIEPVSTEIFFGHTGKFRLEQPLTSSRDNLKGITLAVGNKSGRSFILRIKDGKNIAVQSKHDEKVINEPYTFYFPAISNSKDKTYALEIIVPDDPGKRFAVGFFGSSNPAKGRGTLLIDGVDSKSLLYYRPVYGVSAIEKLGLLSERISMGKPSLFSATGVTLLSLLAAICSAVFFGSLWRDNVPEVRGDQNIKELPEE